MRVAVIGAGISGLVAARCLARRHEVVLFEANEYLGGHTHTHEIEQQGETFAVDSGFIVFNSRHYPHLSALFTELGVASQPTSMSFSAHCERSGLEYSTTSLDALFCQRRNLLSPRFLGMVRDLLRFYREAPGLLESQGPGPTLAGFLAAGRYGPAFRDDHLVPMASALWSSPRERILEFPARYLVQFMANHQMLQVAGRPQWQVVTGGSQSYVRAIRARWSVAERPSCPARRVRRRADAVEVLSRAGVERFDHVVLACHSDEALALLDEPTTAERGVLGAIRYQSNDTILHTDASLLPRSPKAWAAWNAFVPRDPTAPCTVSYWMNLLQGLRSPRPFIVTLNRTHAIDPASVLKRMHYRHPIYDAASVAAQARKAEVQGQGRTWFAGAYWGWGFHEDGVRSALEVAQSLDAPQPVPRGVASVRSAA